MTIIAIAQTKENGFPEENLLKAKKFIEKAKNSNAKIIVFPEAFMSHFPFYTPLEDKETFSEPVLGSFVSSMSKYASKYDMWLIFGIIERSNDVHKPYNTIVVLDNKGDIVSTYRKTHLYDAFNHKESDYLSSGNKLFDPINTPFGKIGIFVCYELRFPEVARNLVNEGSNILIMPAAWVKGQNKVMQFETLIKARAMENTCYVIASNLCGDSCTGNSIIVDPMGVELARASEDNEEILTANIDLEIINESRKILPVLKNRRRDLY